MTELDWTFGMMSAAVEQGAKARAGGAGDSRFISYYAVGENVLAEMLVNGLNQQQYGNLGVHVVSGR